jgi:bacterioferritin-associated ferredoxin
MYVCICNALTDKELSQAAREGAQDVDDAFRMLGAEVCCGECYCMAEEVIESTNSAPSDVRSPTIYVAQAAE